MRTGLLLLLLLLVLSAPAQSQGVTVSTQNALVDALSLADIDFYHSTSPKWLFTIELRSPQPIDVIMVIHMNIALANGDNIPDAVRLTTKPFSVAGARSFTNLDFANNTTLVQDFKISDEISKKYADQVLSSQLLPAGTYAVSVEVSGATAGFAFVLTNPTAIELVSPSEGEQMNNRFPLFQWRFDGQRSRIKVFEQLAGQASLEEAVNGIPHAAAEVTTNSYQYPSAGVRPLQPGNTYVWFVEGATRTTGGTDYTAKSALRSFAITAEGAASMQTYLDELERALGAKYKAVFDQIRAEGLSPTGTIRIDGRAVSALDLLHLIAQFRNDPAAVLTVAVE